MRHGARFSGPSVGPLLVLVLLALLAPAWARAQGPRFLRDTIPPGDPIQVLLARGQDLKLSREQVARLEGIQRRLQGVNAPLVTELVQIRHDARGGRFTHPRQMTPQQRADFRAAVDRARPLMQSIAGNNVRAMEEVGTTLTPEQKQAVRDWIEHAPRGPGRPAMPGGPGPGRRGRGPAGAGSGG